MGGGREGTQKMENHSISDRKSLKRVSYGESLQGQQPASQPASHIDDNNVYNNLFFSPSLSRLSMENLRILNFPKEWSESTPALSTIL